MKLEQAPYRPPAISEVDDFTATARATTLDIRQAASLQAFVTSKQQITLRALPEAVTHPAATLLQYYVEEGIPANTGPPWLRAELDEEIKNRLHVSA